MVQSPLRTSAIILLLSVMLLLVGCVGAPSPVAESDHPSWWYEGWGYAPSPDQSAGDPAGRSGEREYLYIVTHIPLVSPTHEACLREAKKLTPGMEMTRVIANHMAPSNYVCSVHGNAFPGSVGEVLDCCAQSGAANSCKEPGSHLAEDGCVCVLFLKIPGGRRVFENDPVASHMIRCVRAD